MNTAKQLGSASRRLHHDTHRAGTFFPFLYRTKTIRRTYADALDALEEEQGEIDRIKQKWGTTGRARASPRRRSSLQDQQKSLESRRSRGARPVRSEQPTVSVPFEGGSVPSVHDPSSRVEGSTMTPRELRIFENLFRIKASKAGQTTPDTKDGGPIAYPVPLQALAKEAEELRAMAQQSERSQPAPIEGLPSFSNQWLESTKMELDKATTDLDLWNALQSNVLTRLASAQLDDIRLSEVPENFHVLTENLPQVLLHFMKLIQEAFPSSSLAVTILPSLKEMGLSAFALGATTALYNEHMRVLYKQFANLDAIGDTLSEMDKEVYDFDSGTQQLLQEIIEHARVAGHGSLGSGLQAFWLTDRKRRGVAKLARWKETVDKRLHDAAVKRVKEQTADLVGSEMDA